MGTLAIHGTPGGLRSLQALAGSCPRDYLYAYAGNHPWLFGWIKWRMESARREACVYVPTCSIDIVVTYCNRHADSAKAVAEKQ